MERRIIFLALFFVWITVEALADGVAPQYSSFVIQPGETRKVKIILSQTREKECEVSLQPSHCFIDGNGRLLFSDRFSDLKLAVDERSYSAVRFVKPEKIKLKFNEWKEVPLTISVPGNTPPGEYYAAMVTKPSNLVSLISIIVDSGSLKGEGRITSVETRLVNDQLLIQALFENTGSKTIVPSAVSYIKKDGKVIDTVALTAAGRNYEFVMHHNVRLLAGLIQKILPVHNDYTAEVIIDYGSAGKATMTKSFSLDRTTYLRQKAFFTVQVDPTFATLVIPPGGFYAFPISVKNLDTNRMSLKILSSESWVTPSKKEIILEPNEEKSIPIAFLVPRIHEELDVKVVFVPERGRPCQTLIKIDPQPNFNLRPPS